jgi:uncharacterized protein YecT (DUF1311 family)
MIPFVLMGDPHESRKTYHRIDNKMNQCLESPESQSTMGIRECSNRAKEDWEKELNSVYKRLVKLLSKEDQDLLKKSQLAWLEFRKKEIEYLWSMISKLEGSMYPMIADEKEMEITRKRTLELIDYEKIIKE